MTLEELRYNIEQIVDYNWKDEERDFQTQLEEGNPIEGHIFLSIKALAEFLDT